MLNTVSVNNTIKERDTKLLLIEGSELVWAQSGELFLKK